MTDTRSYARNTKQTLLLFPNVRVCAQTSLSDDLLPNARRESVRVRTYMRASTSSIIFVDRCKTFNVRACSVCTEQKLKYPFFERIGNVHRFDVETSNSVTSHAGTMRTRWKPSLRKIRKNALGVVNDVEISSTTPVRRSRVKRCL